MNRQNLIQTAAQTIAICQAGTYTTPSGTAVNIASSIDEALASAQIVALDDVTNLPRQADTKPEITVTAMTTLDAAEKLARQPGHRPTVLVFASARHPGGGFQNGAMAQEEDIAYRSTLFTALAAQTSYYADSINNLNGTLYFDKALHIKSLCTIRDGEYELCLPWKYDAVIAPAPNRGSAITKGISEGAISAAMKRRIDLVLRTMAINGDKDIVLGAFGCGVFKNRPDKVAALFKAALHELGPHFNHVLFAIPGSTSPNYQAFAKAFPANKR